MSSFVYATFTNTDLTEGRGNVTLLRLSCRLEDLEAKARRDGVMGTPSGVDIRRVEFTEASETPWRSPGETVWGYRTLGDGKWGYGRKGEFTELTVKERERLAHLRKVLGEHAPELPGPARAPESQLQAKSVLVVWAQLTDGIRSAPHIYAIRDDYTSATSVVEDLRARNWTVRHGYTGRTEPLPQLVISEAPLDGTELRLRMETALYVEPEGGRTPRKEASLGAEYLELMKKAGYTG